MNEERIKVRASGWEWYVYFAELTVSFSLIGLILFVILRGVL